MSHYDDYMRTTIDIPPGPHERIREFARNQGKSFSATATEVLMRGMAPIEEPPAARRSPVTGLLVINSGRPVTSAEVADLIDEDD